VSSDVSSTGDVALARAATLRPVLRFSPEVALRAQATRGDAGAFEVLYRRHHQALYRYCRSILRHDEDARDALQSTMAKAFAALREEQRDFELRPWLFRIAHNEAISLLRQRRATGELDGERIASRESLIENVADRERLSHLSTDLLELPDRQRAALVLRELNGLGHKEIAAVLECTVGAVKQTIFEARTALHEFDAGRAMACVDVQRRLSDSDGRVLRARRLRAHLRSCGSCQQFRSAVGQRPADLAVIVPPLPLAAGATLLQHLLPGTKATAAGGGVSATGLGGGVAVMAATKAMVVVAVTAALVGGATVAPQIVGRRAAALSKPVPTGSGRNAVPIHSPARHVGAVRQVVARPGHQRVKGTGGLGGAGSSPGLGRSTSGEATPRPSPSLSGGVPSHAPAQVHHGRPDQISPGQGKSTNPTHGPPTTNPSHGRRTTPGGQSSRAPSAGGLGASGRPPNGGSPTGARKGLAPAAADSPPTPQQGNGMAAAAVAQDDGGPGNSNLRPPALPNAPGRSARDGNSG
jgi:RNA polymerase sigma factor (sigma-70 family)